MQPKYLSKEIYHIVNVTEITKSRSDRVSLIITAIFHMYLLDGFTSIMYIGTFKYTKHNGRILQKYIATFLIPLSLLKELKFKALAFLLVHSVQECLMCNRIRWNKNILT